MARVQIYNGHSSIIPILCEISNYRDTPELNVKIKEEPLDRPESGDEYLHYDAADDDPLSTSETQVIKHAKILNVNSTKSNNAIIGECHAEIGSDSADLRLRTRSQSRIIACDICHVTFPDQTSLKTHNSRYNKDKLICHLCKLHFVTPIHLTSHRRSAHRGDDWRSYKYECHYCKLGFRKKHLLQMHIFHYHNINKILESEQSRRRLNNRRAVFIKYEKKTKSKAQCNKRKRDNDRKITGPPQKKLLISANENGESNLQCAAKNDKFNNDDDEPHDIAISQQQYISHNQINNSNSLNSPAKPPLVKICAVPNEVEALLNDCESSDDNFSAYSNDSESGSDFELSDSTDCEPRDEYQLRSSFSNRPSHRELRGRATLLRFDALQKHYKCRDCHVMLERLIVPSSTNSKLINEFADDGDNTKVNETVQMNCRPTVGMELKNLNLALMRLQGEQQKQDEIPTAKTHNLLQESQQPSNKSTIVETPSPTEDTATTILSANKIIYLSSLCQTRYTTKHKLIYHYLCYHTNPHYNECAVCRSQYANLSELKDHLLQHCIEIIESTHEESPINLKGPCENSREKYTCKGCKKKFWLVSYLRDHEKHCQVVHEIDKTNTPNDLQNNGESTSEQEPSDSVMCTRSRQKSIDADKAPPCNGNSSEHIGPQILLRCSVCRAGFKFAANLEEHYRKFSARKTISQCSRCGTQFPSPSLLSSHTRTSHLPNPPFTYKIKCSICEQGFNAKANLREHMMHIHYSELNSNAHNVCRVKNIDKTCRVCKIVFPDRKRYVEHCLYYYDDDVIECAICNVTFSSQCKAHSHTKKMHSTTEMQQSHIYCCSICNENFVYPSHLSSHMYHIHNIDMELYQSIPISENEMAQNNRQGGMHVCEICDAKFTSMTLLIDHKVEYDNVGRYNCLQCGRKCQTLSVLRKHIKLSHSNNNHVNVQKCQTCQEVLESKASWECHFKHVHINLRTIEGESESYSDHNYSMSKPSAAPNITAVPIQTLTKQIEIDTTTDINNGVDNNDDPHTSNPIRIEYTCALCDKKFMNSSHLKIHSLKCGEMCQNNTDIVSSNFSIASIYSVELEDYENLCDGDDNIVEKNRMINQKLIPNIDNTKNECAKMENTVQQINVIKSLQKLNCEVKCDKCHMKFPSRKGLVKHLKLYSNSGDFECSICRRRFASIGNYLYHVRKHQNRQRNTSIPLYYCKTCDEKFNCQGSKDCHFAHIHGVPVKPRKSLMNDSAIRTSARQKSKLLHQTNLDEFMSRDSNSEKSAECNETHNESNINLFNDVDANTVENLELSQIRLENVDMDSPAINEGTQEISDPLLTIVPDTLVSQPAEETIKIVEVEKEVVAMEQIVIEEENEIVDVEKEIVELENEVVAKDKVVEVEEVILEEENVSGNTTPVLCDICGNIYARRAELIAHQNDTHSMELTADSEMQEEYIDIELIDDENDDNKTTNYDDNTDVDIVFDSSSQYNDNDISLITRPIKPGRTYSKKNGLECKICNLRVSNLNALAEHLEKEHQADSPPISHNIQNPCVSSSSKNICNPNIQKDVRHIQLCCRFCGKQFANDQYLMAHIKNNHPTHVNLKLTDNTDKIIAKQERLTNTDITQHNLQNAKKFIYAKNPVTAIKKKNTDSVKKFNDGLILRKILLKPESDILQYPVNQIPTRFPRLVPIARSTLIMPLNRNSVQKSNQHYNNDMSR